MSYELKHWHGDFYSLKPDEGVSVEGHFDDWVKIARAIKAADKQCGAKRCAFVREDGDLFAFYSPRNSMSRHDHILLYLDEADALADSILAQFGHGEHI